MANISRNTFDKLKHYVNVRMQQGIPLVDADWNEMDDIRKDELTLFIKAFAGNGVPGNNDGFNILAKAGSSNDFTIKGGTAAQPGICLVEGWDVRSEADIAYQAQLLYNNTALAAKWGVTVLAALTVPASGTRTDLVYLDAWEREVNAIEDPNLKNPAINIETCTRMKREWVVRVAENTTALPTTVPAGHVFYALATIRRIAGQAAINQVDITDLRATGLSFLKDPIFIKNSNVGIGTPNPSAKLQVSGGAIMPSAGNDANSGICFPPNPGGGGGDSAWIRYYSRSGEATNLEIGTSNDTDDNIILSTAGNVGIGTTTPAAKLEVTGDIVTNVAKISDDPHGADFAAFSHKNQATATGYALLQHKDGDTYLNTPAAKNIRLRINNEDKMFLKSDGNIGIGNSNPSAKVVIQQGTTDPGTTSNGKTLFVSGSYLGGSNRDGGIEFRHDNLTQGIGFGFNTIYATGSNANQSLNLISKGTDPLTLNAYDGGNVGIGTTTPAAKLQVSNGAIMPATGNSDTAGILFPKDAFGGSGDAAWIRYYARSAESTTLEIGNINDPDDHIVLISSGNVGIGTATPQKKLHVSGGSLFDGQQNHFKDAENKGRLRVGAAWGIPGLYSEDSEDLVLGVTSNNNVCLGNANNFVTVTGTGNLNFPTSNGQKVNLYQTVHGMGVQGSTTYFRTSGHFGFFQNGTHDDNVLNPGTGGTAVMVIRNGNVGIGTNDPGGDKLDIRGRCYAQNGFSTTNADYAEYFESENGQVIPRGTSILVTPEGKIRSAKPGETPIGIISVTPSIVGNVPKEWPGKYLRDDFGEIIMETYEEEGVTKTRPTLNPQYDESKEYITRDSDRRPEWNCVGILGQLPMLKGQPTAPTWFKIKDISETVELWLVK